MDMKDKEPDIRDSEKHLDYSDSISEDDIKQSFSLEDERWQTRYQIRDWLILGAMVAITLAWTLIIYFMEPGLR